MPTKQTEDKEEKNPFPNPCPGVGTPLHNLIPVTVGIFLIKPDGDAEQIGEAITCGAAGVDYDKKRSWECWKYPTMTRKFANFPYHWIKREDVGKPSYWLEWGWHFMLLGGRYINFNAIENPFGDLSGLKLQHRKAVEFVKKHALSDVEIVVEAVKHSPLEASVSFSKVPSHGIIRKAEKGPDAYQPEMPEFGTP